MYTLGDIFQGDYPVTQTFGANPGYYGQFYIYGIKQKGHEGIDWGTPIGTNITAPFNGRVLRTGRQGDFPGYGEVVVVWDSVQKCAVWFCHLNSVSVAVGQTVTKGQILGKTGITGNVTGPHLHFMVVETDAQGNRLHPYDGYGGFINPLGGLINWVIGTPPVDEYIKKWDTLLIAVNRLNNESNVLNSNPDKKKAYDETMAKVKKIAETGTL